MNYKLSPSDLTYLYDGCKFCFWLKVKLNISQPSMQMPGIFSVIATKQKEFYANKRTEEFCPELPPGVVIYNEQWVQSKVISFNDRHGCFIRGRFDCVVKFDDNSYGVIDFKTASPSDKKVEMYARQLNAYAYALENPDNNSSLNLAPITKLGLIFFEPISFEQLSLDRQSFVGSVKWVEVKRDDKQFLEFVKGAMEVLVMERPPEPANDCPWCKYRRETARNFSLRGLF